MAAIQLLLVTGFIIVHLFSGNLRFLDEIPRSRWLSLAGGISVAYVFLHIFPELEEAQQRISAAGPILPFIEHHAYLVSLLGIIVFYGLERLVKTSKRRGGGETAPATGVFRLHMASLAFYNGLIGYLLVHREEQTPRGLFFYFVAMALHFVVNDYGLRQDHQEKYRRAGRWVLAAAILAGWMIGLGTTVGRGTIGVLFAFLAGGVILNVLKEELPEERQSRFLPFALGAAGYAALLLLL